MLLRSCSLGVSIVVMACHADRVSFDNPGTDTEAALGQARCGVVKSSDKPLVVEWPAAERAELESRARQGLVAVRYEGCEMEVLSQCTVPGAYAYVGLTTKHETVRIRSADELYARLPVGAASLEGQLERSGELGVDLTVVGRQEADALEVSRYDLRGSCDRATHFVSGLTVGAFSMYAGQGVSGGAGVEVAGAGVGARRSSEREVLRDDGDPAACVGATTADEAPPQGCGALLRVEVVPLSDRTVARRVEVDPAVVEPTTREPSEPTPGEPATDEPSEPAPGEPDEPAVVDRPAGSCDGIDFEVVGITRKRADPPFHDRPLDRVSLRIHNRGSEPVELAGGSDASFLDEQRGLIDTDVHDEWWMPKRLPANSSVVVRVLMPRNAGKTLRSIEVDAEPEGARAMPSKCRVVDAELGPAEGGGEQAGGAGTGLTPR